MDDNIKRAKKLLESAGYLVESSNIDSKMDDIETRLEEIIDSLRDTHDEDTRSEYIGELESLEDDLVSMEDDMTDEQYKRSEDLRHDLHRAKDTDYEGDVRVNYDPYKERGLNRSDFY